MAVWGRHRFDSPFKGNVINLRRKHVIALMEGYQWTLPTLLGLSTVMIGNWLVMRASKA